MLMFQLSFLVNELLEENKMEIGNRLIYNNIYIIIIMHENKNFSKRKIYFYKKQYGQLTNNIY